MTNSFVRTEYKIHLISQMILISKTIANDDKMLGNMLTTLITLVIISSATGLDFGFESPVVKVWQGKVLGKEMTSTEGKKFYAFLGIPYGKITKRFKVSSNGYLQKITLVGNVIYEIVIIIPNESQVRMLIHGLGP